MKAFIGLKTVQAEPMTLGDYKTLSHHPLEDFEKPEWPGYMIRHKNGHITWNHKESFEETYREQDGLTFGQAIEAMKKGYKVARKGWNGKGMFIVFMSGFTLPPFNTQGTERKVNDRTARWIGEDAPLDSQPYFAMFTAAKQWQPGWLASQADMLAEDWGIIE